VIATAFIADMARLIQGVKMQRQEEEKKQK
jgi:hypothetical protein